MSKMIIFNNVKSIKFTPIVDIDIISYKNRKLIINQGEKDCLTIELTAEQEKSLRVQFEV